MMKLILIILLLFSSEITHAEEIKINLENARINTHDIQSIQRGAVFFAKNCIACHTLIYMRYNKLAQKAGITYEKMPVNIKNWPNNITPPDLSLEASYRGADWIFTYLHSFYFDPARPSKINNLLVPNTAMSGILSAYQGKQILISNAVSDSHQWYDYLKLESQGSMSPQEFDATIRDVVNFLVYAAAPYAHEQHELGYWVIGFLLILFVLLYLLKKAYWKNIK